jgi:hypothetical protein
LRSGQPSATALLVAAISSAAAAVVVHALWAPGTIAGAAVTPVLVTLFDELLRHPLKRLRLAEQARPAARPSHDETEALAYPVYVVRPRWWRVLTTGMAAFVLGTASLTAAELILHRSLGNRGQQTTLLGGARAPTPRCAPQAPAPAAPQQHATVTVPARVHRAATRPGADRRQGPDRTARRTPDRGSPQTTTTPEVTSPSPDTTPTTTIQTGPAPPPADAPAGTPPPAP